MGFAGARIEITLRWLRLARVGVVGVQYCVERFSVFSVRKLPMRCWFACGEVATAEVQLLLRRCSRRGLALFWSLSLSFTFWLVSCSV